MLAISIIAGVIVVALLGVWIENHYVQRRRVPGKPAALARRRAAKTPLGLLNADLKAARVQRRDECSAIRSATAASLSAADRPEDGHFPGHVVLVHDVWSGLDFTQRNRAVGASWLPFVDPPRHVETAKTAAQRFTRAYRLNDDEKKLLTRIEADNAGRIAVAAGYVAARIHRYPAWSNPFFDNHGVRVDLGAEVAEVAQIAKTLQKQRELLGPEPNVALREDPEIITLYIDKARTLDRRIDGLMERLRSLSEYREVVANIQKRLDKLDWKERVGAIDGFEHDIAAEADRHQGEQIRRTASDSDVLGSIYLDTLAPLAESLLRAD